MLFDIINVWAVLVASVITMALGAGWYSPYLFGKKWQALMGCTSENMAAMKEKSAGMGKLYAINFVGNIVTNLVLAYIVFLSGAIQAPRAIFIAVIIWIGFMLTTGISGMIWENKSWKLVAINTGYSLVSFIISALIFALWI